MEGADTSLTLRRGADSRLLGVLDLLLNALNPLVQLSDLWAQQKSENAAKTIATTKRQQTENTYPHVNIKNGDKNEMRQHHCN